VRVEVADDEAAAVQEQQHRRDAAGRPVQPGRAGSGHLQVADAHGRARGLGRGPLRGRGAHGRGPGLRGRRDPARVEVRQEGGQLMVSDLICHVPQTTEREVPRTGP
jgi:hypothetical protein